MYIYIYIYVQPFCIYRSGYDEFNFNYRSVLFSLIICNLIIIYDYIMEKRCEIRYAEGIRRIYTFKSWRVNETRGSRIDREIDRRLEVTFNVCDARAKRHFWRGFREWQIVGGSSRPVAAIEYVYPPKNLLILKTVTRARRGGRNFPPYELISCPRSWCGAARRSAARGFDHRSDDANGARFNNECTAVGRAHLTRLSLLRFSIFASAAVEHCLISDSGQPSKRHGDRITARRIWRDNMAVGKYSTVFATCDIQHA